MLQRIVFCDFDGTITAQETFVAVLKQFAPELAAELMPQMYDLSLPLRVGVRRILESIPSRVYPDILEFGRTQPQRPGLVALLDFLDTQNVPFVVVSGGIQGMVEAALAPIAHRIHGIHGVQLHRDSAYFQVQSDFEGDTELVAKVQVMAQYGAAEQIAIGDSVTDLNMALQASLVFARDRLADYLEARQHPYLPWTDFDDIRQQLEQRWAPSKNQL